MKNYRKKNVQPMRPYVLGEDLSGVSVSAEDTPEVGGMIAVNPENGDDRWYVAKAFYDKNYEEADLNPAGVAPLGSFSWALMRLKEGAKVARSGWNGSGMFAYMVPGNSYPAQTEAIKGHFAGDLVPYRPYFALKTAQNDVATWVPSGSDIIADDWEEIE
jgi:hypothetical protein